MRTLKQKTMKMIIIIKIKIHNNHQKIILIIQKMRIIIKEDKNIDTKDDKNDNNDQNQI